MNQRTYYRIQPAGLPLRGWTSQASGDGRGLPRGYVYAHTSPVVLCFSVRHEWSWATGELESAEVIVFRGRDEYDPGDYEGVAVRPGRVLSRIPLTRFLREHPEDDDVE